MRIRRNFKTKHFIQSSQITTLQHSIILHIFDTLLFNRELFILSQFSISKVLFRFYYWDEDINIVNKLMIWKLATLVQEQNKTFHQNDCRNVWCILSRKKHFKKIKKCSSFCLSCIWTISIYCVNVSVLVIALYIKIHKMTLCKKDKTACSTDIHPLY